MADAAAAESGTLALPPALDLAAAQSLKEALIAAAMSGGPVLLDGVDVERVGTPAVQVLLAGQRSFAAEGRRFGLTRPSAALRAAFDDLGLSRELQRWGGI